jgi:hypothetical protein
LAKKTEEELESLGLRNIWKSRRNNDKKVWIKLDKRFFYIEKQNAEAKMRERNSPMFCNGLRSS